MPGKYVDDAVNNPEALIADEIQEKLYRSHHKFFWQKSKASAVA
jgi:hypothetical protein